jgi:hypothetical protein
MWHVRAGRRHFLPPESRMLVRPCATPVRQGIVSHEQHRRHRPHVHLWPALILGREQCGVVGRQRFRGRPLGFASEHQVAYVPPPHAPRGAQPEARFSCAGAPPLALLELP